MKESKAYKTYLGHTIGVVPPKIARKFKKVSPFKKDSIHVQADEEPVQKGKQVKRSAKKSSTTPAAGIVFRETLVKTKSTGKEKVDVLRGKGIDLLSEVALAEKAQLKEITPTVISEGTGDKPGVLDVTNDDSSKSESESWGNDKDDSNNEQESSDESSKQENESEEQDEESDDDDQEQEDFDQENKSKDDEMKSEEEQGMDDTTDQFDDDADLRLEEPTKTATGIVQGEGNDAEMTEAQQGNKNLETTQEQVVEDVYVTISTVPKKTKVPVTSSSRSSVLASKFLIFLDITQTDAEIVSPLDVHVHHEVLRTQALTLLTIPVSVIPESSSSSRHKVGRNQTRIMIQFKLHSRIKEQVKDQLPQIQPQEVSNFAPPMIEKLNKESRDEVTLAKKRKLSKDVEPTTELKKKDSTSGSSKGTNPQPKSSSKFVQSEEPMFEVADSDLPQYQEGNLGDSKDEPKNDDASRRWTNPKFSLMTLAAYTSIDKSLKDFDELMSTPIDFSGYILNDLKIKNLTQEVLLGPAFRLLKAHAPSMQSRGDVYYTKRIMAVTHVSVIRKHGYGYLEEIVVRKANNALYRFKEGDDVADFAIALRMFTRSLVIQKRVDDL
ncbi:hypothetical protein Tco_0359996 [Tanacetum coccineum]